MCILLFLSLAACRNSQWPEDTQLDTAVDTGASEIDADGDGFSAEWDCDDTNPEINPDALEVCDGVDNDCDDLTDEELLIERFIDADEDGYGQSGVAMACPDAVGFADQDGDCDDAESLANPGLEEVCNDQIDNDCDGGSNDCAPSGAASTSSAVWGLLGSQEEDLVGLQVFGSSDLDGDGLGEILVGSLKGGREVPESGSAFLLRSQPSGANEVTSVVETTLTSTQERDFLGYCVHGGADLSGDGQADWLACAPGDVNRDDGLAYEDRGEVLVYSSDLSGAVDARSSALVRIAGEDASSHFGLDAKMSDLGGPLLAVGARGQGDLDGQGAVYLFEGPLSGEMSSADHSGVILDDRDGEFFGRNVDLVDLNGDGQADLLATGMNGPESEDGRGTVAWFMGPVEGTVRVSDASGELLGRSESIIGQGMSTGDVDGDGYLDLAASNFEDGATGAYIFAGPIDGALSLDDAVAFIGEEVTTNGAGSYLDLGDVDNDGKADLLMGAWQTPDNTKIGQAYLFMGPFAGDLTMDSAQASWGHDGTESAFGGSVSITPDTTGDGTADILIGAPYTGDEASYGGAVWLFAGSGL